MNKRPSGLAVELKPGFGPAAECVAARADFASSRDSSIGEELANSISHGVGFLLAGMVALPLLIVHAACNGGTAAAVTATIFGGSAIVL